MEPQQLADLIATVEAQKVLTRSLQTQLAENQRELAEVKGNVRLNGTTAAQRLVASARTRGQKLFGREHALPTFTIEEQEQRGSDRIPVVTLEELSQLQILPELVKFADNGLLERVAGKSFERRVRPLKEGGTLAERQKWYNQDLNRWEDRIMHLHILLRKMMEAFAADADLTEADVRTCLKDTTKIVVSAVGEAEEIMSPDELQNIKEHCHAAKSMATILAHMRLEIDMLAARGSESVELIEITAELEERARIQTTLDTMSAEPLVSAKLKEMVEKRHSAVVTAQAKATAAAAAAAKAPRPKPFVVPRPVLPPK